MSSTHGNLECGFVLTSSTGRYSVYEPPDCFIFIQRLECTPFDLLLLLFVPAWWLVGPAKRVEKCMHSDIVASELPDASTEVAGPFAVSARLFPVHRLHESRRGCITTPRLRDAGSPPWADTDGKSLESFRALVGYFFYEFIQTLYVRGEGVGEHPYANSRTQFRIQDSFKSEKKLFYNYIKDFFIIF